MRGILCGRQPPRAVQTNRRQRQIGGSGDDRRDLLAARGVRRRQHARIGDAGNLPENALDFVRLHLAARHVDERRHPAGQHQLAVAGHESVVAGEESAVPEVASPSVAPT